MSLRDQVRKAETLRRVAELQQRQSLIEASRARREAELQALAVERAREVVALAGRERVENAGDLQARHARLTALAASLADLTRQSTQASLQAAHAADLVMRATVVLRGRERLVSRRREELVSARLKSEQALLDEIASLGAWGEEQ